MKISTLIVDDEPHALEILEKYIAHFPEIELVDKCYNAVQAFQILQKKAIDLLFLDIKMPGLLGTELVRTLKNPPRIIFTTAYQDYALEGFDLNAVDYLLKPIPFDRFLKAMDKVFNGYNPKQLSVQVSNHLVSETKNDSYLYLRVERRMVKINVNDIYWVESLKDYVKVALSDKTYVSKQKISVLEELLPEDKFVRIHRSFIVSIEKVQSYHSFAIEILGRELPIGRNYKEECRKRLR